VILPSLGFPRLFLAGDLEGLEALPVMGGSWRPSPTSMKSPGWSERRTAASPTGQAEAGADLDITVRHGVMLDLTLDTEPARVEVADG